MDLITIGSFLKRIKDPIEIQDNIEYKRITIKTNHQGVILRNKELGTKIGTKKQFKIKGGDFILSKIDARNGAFGIIPDELDGAIITGNFWTYEVDTKKVDTEWFFYFTHSFDFMQICKKSSTGTTHRKYLNEKIFLSQQIYLPKKQIQIKMVKRYKESSEKGNSLIAEIQSQKQLISELKQSILQEAIQGKLTAVWRKQNPDVEPASELLKRIKAEKAQLIKDKKIRKEKPLPPITEDEIPFELPEGWVWCRLGEIGFTQTGTTPPKNDNSNYGNFIPFIQPSNISNEGLDFNCISLSKKGLLKSRFIPKHSNLMVCIGGSAGKTCYNDVDVACNQQINTITGFNGIFHKYLDIVLKSPHFQSLVWSKIKKGSTPILNKGKWSEILVPICGNEEQKAIVEKVETLMQKCNALEQEITQSEQHANMLMQAVLKEAFEGKMKIED